MKKRGKQFLACLLLVALGLLATGCGFHDSQSKTPGNTTQSKNGTFGVVASFYPMQILCMNLCDGIPGVTESSMSDPNLGCIHDHTFTVNDLKKVEDADVFVENGMGLEAFNEQIRKTYPNLPVIEASACLQNPNDASDASEGDEEEVNAHVWTNPDYYIQQIQYVGDELQKLDPAHAKEYAANTQAYIEKVKKVEADTADIRTAAAGKKVLVLDETLPHFCDYCGLDWMEIEMEHESESLPASALKDTISKMKKEHIRSIFITKGGDRKYAEAISKETGAKIYELNSCMTGEETMDAYLQDLRENFRILATIQ